MQGLIDMGNQLQHAWSRLRARTSGRVVAGDDSHDTGSTCANPPARQLLAVTSRGVFEEETELTLLAASPSGHVARRVWSRDVGCLHPHSPQMRAHGGLVSLVGADGRLRILDPAAEQLVTVLPAAACACFVLGQALGGARKVLGITTDSGFRVGAPAQSCRVLTVGGAGGGVEGGGAWRAAQAPPATVRSTKAPWKAVAAGGVVYVLAARLRRDTPSPDGIAAFDLEAEQWRRDLIQGPPRLRGHSNAVTSLTELDGRLVAVSGSVRSDAAIRLFLLAGAGGDEQEREAMWQPLCAVPTSQVRCRREKGQAAEQLVWVLDGGKVAFVAWSGADATKPWVLRVYDPRTKACQDVARLFSPVDLAMGTLYRP